MNIQIVPYSNDQESLWDEWCQEARNATFLHTKKFLNYHGDRFKDLSLLIYQDSELVAIFPAAEDRNDPSHIISHPGATFGGIVHQGRLGGGAMIRALEAVKSYYRELGYSKLTYKVTPYAYASFSAQDDLYALFRLNARRVRCDLSSIITLSEKRTPSKRRLRSLKKASKQVEVEVGEKLLPEFWQVLSENLERKHEAKPVHTYEEMRELIKKFSQEIEVYCGLINGAVQAGVLFFNSPSVCHAQYIASSEIGYAASALDAVFEKAIEGASKKGVRYFDFGISNEENGQILNEGLYRFKSEFGGGGMVHEFYEVDLEK